MTGVQFNFEGREFLARVSCTSSLLFEKVQRAYKLLRDSVYRWGEIEPVPETVVRIFHLIVVLTRFRLDNSKLSPQSLKQREDEIIEEYLKRWSIIEPSEKSQFLGQLSNCSFFA